MTAPFPTVLPAPTLAELNALLKQLAAVPLQPKNAPVVVALDDDWTTRGDWLGRYGRYWANLCALIAPGDYIWGAGENVPYAARIGANADASDAVRYWVSELYNSNQNTLEIPPAYFDSRLQKKLTSPERNRRQAEIDDHGETYQYTKDGPHLYVSLQIPDGVFTLSLYDWNKDGDSGDNRKRDYRVSIRAHDDAKPLDDIADFSLQPERAHARIRDFRRGVWKRFLVRGPRQLTIKVDKNDSLNTILAGVMLDETNERPAPYFRAVKADRVLETEKMRFASARLAATPILRAQRFAPAANEAVAAARLFDALESLRLTNPTWHAQNSRRFYLPLSLWSEKNLVDARAAARENNGDLAARKAPYAMLASCYYQMRMFPNWEKCQRLVGLVPARDLEKAIRFNNEPRDSGQGRHFLETLLTTRKQNKN